jgi:hypothetical protein
MCNSRPISCILNELPSLVIPTAAETLQGMSARNIRTSSDRDIGRAAPTGTGRSSPHKTHSTQSSASEIRGKNLSDKSQTCCLSKAARSQTRIALYDGQRRYLTCWPQREFTVFCYFISQPVLLGITLHMLIRRRLVTYKSQGLRYASIRRSSSQWY